MNQNDKLLLSESITKLKELILCNHDPYMSLQATVFSSAIGCLDLIPALKQRYSCAILYGDEVNFEALSAALIILGHFPLRSKDQTELFSSPTALGFSLDALFPPKIKYIPKKLPPGALYFFFLVFSFWRAGLGREIKALEKKLFNTNFTLQHYKNKWMSILLEIVPHELISSPANYLPSGEKYLITLTGSAVLKSARGDKGEIVSVLGSVIEAMEGCDEIGIEVLVNLCLLFPKLWRLDCSSFPFEKSGGSDYCIIRSR